MYKLNHNQVENPVCPGVGIGTSLRPGLEKQLGVGQNVNTGPGQYKTMSTLGGNVVMQKSPMYSFTTVSSLCFFYKCNALIDSLWVWFILVSLFLFDSVSLSTTNST